MLKVGKSRANGILGEESHDYDHDHFSSQAHRFGQTAKIKGKSG